MAVGDVLVRAIGFHIIAQVEVLVPQPFSGERLARPHGQVDAFAAGALAEVVQLMIAFEVSNNEVARLAEGLDRIDDGNGRSERWQSALDDAKFVGCMISGDAWFGILAAAGERAHNFGLNQ